MINFRWKVLKTGHKVLVLLVVLGMIQIAWYYPQLPREVVMHWDASGNPDYTAHRAVMAVVLVLVLILLGTFAWMFGYQSELFRNSRLPNHKYWNAPERFERTLGIIGSCHQRVGDAFMVFWLIVNHKILSDNIPGQKGTFSLVGYALIAFLAYASFEYLRTWLYFRKTR